MSIPLFKVHSCKDYYDVQRVLYRNSLLLMFIMFTMACSMFCHLHKQPYLMHERENPQETFGGGQGAKVLVWQSSLGLDVCTYDNLLL